MGSGTVTNPDDYAAGGRLVFTFEAPVIMQEVQLLDIDSGFGTDNRVRTYDRPTGGSKLFEAIVPLLGNNSFQIVKTSNDPRVRRLEVVLRGSGAVAAICYQTSTN